jgi:phosphoglucosamine mutase
MTDRIQGTDGIRRPTITDDDPLARGLSPLDVLLKLDRVSPAFFQLYIYAFVRWLAHRAGISSHDEILVGTDPRDHDGVYLQAVLDAIRRAGATAVNIGIVPTPAVPLLLSRWNASAGIMLTASHNPPEHHGIKLFLPHDQKAYPADDRTLTEEVLGWGREDELPEVAGGSITGRVEDARRAFMDYSCCEENTWLPDASSRSRVLLVIDPAHGSLSGIAREALEKLGFGLVEEVNPAGEAPVNHLSGVADLEGVESITRDDISAGGRFHDYPALYQLFAVADQDRKELLTGTSILLGLVFDADGDRFFCLPWIPHLDQFAVLSGDETAILQAGYLAKHRKGKSRRGLYVNTVESDLEAARHAARLGFDPRLTAVGDKWVLREAQMARLEAAFDFCHQHGLTGERTADLEEIYTTLRNDPESSALTIADLWRDIGYLVPTDLRVAYQTVLSNPDGLGYTVGSEETGHNITAGIYQREDGSPFMALAGNGLKSATNTLASILDMLGESKADEPFWQAVIRPFPRGFKQNLYVYWVKKELFTPGNDFHRELDEKVLELLTGLFHATKPEMQSFPAEPTMAYYSARWDGEQVLACFVRPSGTEDKAGIYLRGTLDDTPGLLQLGEQLYLWLWQRLPDKESRECQRQSQLLAQLANRTVKRDEALAILVQCGSTKAEWELQVMEQKQHLIFSINEEFALTDLGEKVTALV